MQTSLYPLAARRLLLAALFLVFLVSPMALAQNEALPVRKGGKWGAVSITGEQVLPYEYDYVGPFDAKGYAVATKGGRTGLVFANGSIVLPLEYDDVDPLPTGTLRVKKGAKYGLAEYEGDVFLPVEYDWIEPLSPQAHRLQKDGKWGVLDRNAEISVAVECDSVADFERGTLATRTYKGKKIGVVSVKGAEVFAPQFEEVFVSAQAVRGVTDRGKIEVVYFDETGQVKESQSFVNETAYLAAKKQERNERIRSEAEDPAELKKPRWVLEGFDWRLVDAFGNDFLNGQTFYDVSIDEATGLSLARQVIEEEGADKQEPQGPKRTRCTVIDVAAGKTLFSVECKDMFVGDFAVNDYARVTLDTMWDGRVSRDGTVTRRVGKYPLTNMGNFYEGMAWFESEGKYGFVNAKNEVVVEPQYQIVSDYQDGFAIVRKEGKFGLVDKTGRVTIPILLDGMTLPYEGLVRVKRGAGAEGRWGMMDTGGKMRVRYLYEIIGKFEDGLAKIRQDGKFGLIDAKGAVVLGPSIEADDIELADGLLKLRKDRSVDNSGVRPILSYKYMGYADQKGNVLLPPVYTAIEDFPAIWQKNGGLTRVRLDDKTGYVDYAGRVVLKPEYDRIDGFDTVWKTNSGIVEAVKGGKVGYIDHNATTVVPFVYDEVFNFAEVWGDSLENRYARARKGERYGCIDYKGKVAVPFNYEFLSDFHEGQAIARKGGKWGVIDREENEVIPFEYDGIKYLDGSDKGLYHLMKGQRRHYLIGTDGQIVEQRGEAFAETGEDSPADFKKISGVKYLTEFDANGEAVARDSKGRVGIIDGKGDWVVKPNYEEMGPFRAGLAVFRERKGDRRYGYLDRSGKEVIAAQYIRAESFSDGLAAVMDKSRKYGYIDTKGKTVIAPAFKEAGAFTGGYAFVENGQLIDRTGTVLGRFAGEGEVEAFLNERAVVSGPEGDYHLTPAGQPAYSGRYDAVTPFYGPVAYVRLGDYWLLTRKTGERESKLRFTGIGKRQYLAQYGEGRVIEDKFGNKTQDVEWTQVRVGKWRMIDRNGHFPDGIVYDEVKLREDGQAEAFVEALYGIYGRDGKPVVEVECDRLLPVGKGGVTRLERAGETAYLNAEGEFIVPFK